MSTNTEHGNDAFATVGPDGRDFEGYDSAVLENGQLLLFRWEEGGAWIQSDDYVDLTLMA